MTPNDHIRLQELLLQRQELFASIFKAESEMISLTEGEFKIPAVPIALASSQKFITKKNAKPKTSKVKIPALPHRQAFYLIKSGETREETYESRALLMARLKLQDIPITSSHLAHYRMGLLEIISDFSTH
ncbi:hypothetical protein PQO03_18605 [Lentisphaera profundi]|uniref:Uncharacterized protein n=1 Tax=Lentisphaera profundi TaxID=1658616 RepID=A0ABY7VXB0_9BACT|nr:hypothetical protein [Lentisphaera profundi]WDE97840.1 hypothetical protein PQO03_18605 [Lentisphaera profundi]